MMDPELMRLAQEQMSKISPDDLLKMQQQMMANPDLLRMASENMKNMKPEDIRFAAEQMKHLPKEDMAEISERISRASPEEIAAMKAHANLQSAYQLQGAQNLKNQGNRLHAQGKYSEAAEKYLQARTNLTGIPFSESKSLLLASLLNLMSCYLKTQQFEECVQTGSEVLAYDAVNAKALYRRGQAYKQIGKLELAVADLRKAVEVSPDDETIAQALREASTELMEKGGIQEDRHGLHIEEITEEEAVQLTDKKDLQSAPLVTSVIGDISDGEQRSEDQNGFFKDRVQATNVPNGEMYADSLRNLSENPDMLRTMQSLMENVNPESLVALSGGKLTPDMVKTVSGMFSRMSPEELQNMMKISSNLSRQNQASSSTFDDMRNGHSVMGSSQSVSVDNGLFEENQNRVGESSMNLSSSAAFSGMPNFSAEMQEQVRNQMNNPATRQMFSSMIQNMSPETMASMSEQFGIKLSHEEAVKAQTAMASLSPTEIDRLMNWAARLQTGIDYARKIKNWILGRPGLIFSISMLFLAIILHRLGYIGV